MSCIDNKTSSPKSQDGNPPFRDVTAKKQQAVECARKAECSENVRFGKFLPRFNENLRQNYLTAYDTYAIFMTSRQARGGKGTDPPLPTLKTLVKSKEELFYGTDAQRTDTGLPVGDGVRRCAGRSLILPDPRADSEQIWLDRHVLSAGKGTHFPRRAARRRIYRRHGAVHGTDERLHPRQEGRADERGEGNYRVGGSREGQVRQPAGTEHRARAEEHRGGRKPDGC